MSCFQYEHLCQLPGIQGEKRGARRLQASLANRVISPGITQGRRHYGDTCQKFEERGPFSFLSPLPECQISVLLAEIELLGVFPLARRLGPWSPGTRGVGATPRVE